MPEYLHAYASQRVHPLHLPERAQAHDACFSRLVVLVRFTFGAKDAVLDFRAIHGLEDGEHTLVDIDGTGAYFRKGKDTPLQRHRYLDALRTSNYKPLKPFRRTIAELAKLTSVWEQQSPASAEERKRSSSLQHSWHLQGFGAVCGELCPASPNSKAAVGALKADDVDDSTTVHSL